MDPGDMRQAELPGGHKVAVYNVDGDFYATDDLCTHGQSSLSDEGMLDGKVVECSWHFGAFDVTTGEALQMPCREPLKTWPVTVLDGVVCVVLEEESK
jgi:p-cumate 2,3-dioxygenase ferredoxin subunit